MPGDPDSEYPEGSLPRRFAPRDDTPGAGRTDGGSDAAPSAGRPGIVQPMLL